MSYAVLDRRERVEGCVNRVDQKATILPGPRAVAVDFTTVGRALEWCNERDVTNSVKEDHHRGLCRFAL